MQIVRILSASEPVFDALLRIYTEAHPANERKSLDALARMITRPEYLFLAAIDADAVIGFALAIAFQNSDAALLEYMAVDSAHRGRGLGQQLFRAVANHHQMQDRLLLVEVDSDRTPSADPEDRARRKHFYRQLGCKQIEGLIYRMPRISSAEPPPMDLLVYRKLPDTVEKQHLRTWLESCYTQVYDQHLPDARIEAMLAGLPDLVPLA